ncbi:alpha-galactosidase [Caloramator quimbayensis]|uniref:Alpha-galactosidase n=1 Tax=Caloramator quimbayensis TaxID=1147123 RepID=A0A1T4YA86_9CLOT|nr:alpha-galactosidase [Caloramator quimbayensis]SKA98727.1 alpha-galactosidase [Caloramator quimbayensis]
MIIYNEEKRIFHLKTKSQSYIMQIHNTGRLFHVYYGQHLKEDIEYRFYKNIKRPSFSAVLYRENISLDTVLLEYPCYGNTDCRVPALEIQYEDGSTVTDLKYKSHMIMEGKPKLAILPSTYCTEKDKVQTLKITLEDKIGGIEVELFYSVFEDYNAITRWSIIKNLGENKVKILRALSAVLNFTNMEYNMITLNGAWARERNIETAPLRFGFQCIDSKRGSSSHMENPFIAFTSKNANEECGEVYGMNLIYSGNFIAGAEVDQFRTTRAIIGINPFDFSWVLQSGESFVTPEAVLVYSNSGLGEMSRIYHKFYRERLCKGIYKASQRPILINNWEATYFNFNEEKLLELAKQAKEMGIELFVLDDGWFGERNDDTSSLGDWYVNTKKIPSGIKGFSKKINALGLKFGLWFEPEMVSRNSSLFKNHPDWCIHVNGREMSEGRNQLILDLSREDVREYIKGVFDNILEDSLISYIKWDMNRNMTEIGSSSLPPERQRETAHRYILGLYEILEYLTSKYPDILFEGCSGGGGRFDGGILYYMPQIWTSDNTDAIERAKIQYGTSLVYPISSMGAHVSICPNHQVGRVTPINTRGNIAMSGVLGYELNLSKLDLKEKRAIKHQIEKYNKVRDIVLYGDFYRLRNPFEKGITSWMFVSEDKNRAFFVYAKSLNEANTTVDIVRLKGLDENKVYLIRELNKKISGDVLMKSGIDIFMPLGDFVSLSYTLEAEL